MELFPDKSKIHEQFPKFSKPEIIGTFSVNSQRQFEFGLRNLKYLKIPKTFNFNLNLNDDEYVEKPEEAKEEKLNHLLEFLMSYQKFPSSKWDEVIKDQKVDSNFVCFRGLLRLISCTPYENEQWIILATKYKETIYLCAEETRSKYMKRKNETFADRKFSRYGFKFENHILSSEPHLQPPGFSEPVIEAEEFCTMFKAKLDNKRIIYGAELDGCISNQPITNLAQLERVELVEVKVKRKETSEQQLRNFHKFKTRNWWCQSFLIGIDKIYVGIRDDNGNVHDVKPMSLRELKTEAQMNNYWHPTVCMNFLNDFLNKVASDMKYEDDPYTIYKYEFDPYKKYITFKVINDREYAFITKDFVNFMRKL